jgi:hypothetical protein
MSAGESDDSTYTLGDFLKSKATASKEQTDSNQPDSNPSE